MSTQNKLMIVSPSDGTSAPYPSHAAQWRIFHGKTAWLFNPWTGSRRCAEDVGSDTFGELITDGMGDLTAESKQ